MAVKMFSRAVGPHASVLHDPQKLSFSYLYAGKPKRMGLCAFLWYLFCGGGLRIYKANEAIAKNDGIEAVNGGDGFQLGGVCFFNGDKEWLRREDPIMNIVSGEEAETEATKLFKS